MRKHLLIFLSLCLIMACTDQHSKLEEKTRSLKISWEHMGNDAQAWICRSSFILENTGKEAFSDSDWKLYYNQMGSAPTNSSISEDVEIKHLNGDWLCLSPKAGFELASGEKLEIAYEKPGRLLKEIEAPSGLYLVFEQEGEEFVFAVENYRVLPFPDLDQIFPADSEVPLPDAEWTHGQNQGLKALEVGDYAKVLPRPGVFEKKEGVCILDTASRIGFDPALINEANYLGTLLESVMEPVPLEEGKGEIKPGMIRLVLDRESTGNAEAYSLEVGEESGIEIRATHPSGVFYGIQSLLSLLPVSAWSKLNEKLEIESVSINDTPAFEYRGMMLDVSRNFHSSESIRRLIRVMAYYKLNHLHLSLTNDEGWRVEIPGLPELTSVGAFRGHSSTSKDHLIPSYGSGPHPDPERGLGNGFLSSKEFIELLEFAAGHHITIVPEINFPGHARAAIYSMEARYERFMEEGRVEEALEYRLIDPDDSSVYNSAQNFNDNVICVCDDGIYRFMEKVVDEIAIMYETAGLELETLHVGGDEVPVGAWTDSPICTSFLKEHPEVGEIGGFQPWFEGRLQEILAGRGISMAGWEEIGLLKDNEGKWISNESYVGTNMMPFVWNSLGESLDLGNRMANAGFPVVLCNVDNLYFDLAYTHHPEEPGHYWGGFVDTKRAWTLAPFNVFHSTLSDSYRRPCGPEKDFSGFEELKPEARKNIRGIQAALWSETLRGPAMLEYYYLPKLLGLAERAWCGEAAWGSEENLELRVKMLEADWNRFAHRLGHRELPRLDYLFGGYNYRIPAPGAAIVDGVLNASCAYPGLEIRYTTNGKVPDSLSELYQGPVEVDGRIRICAFDSRGRGSRISEVQP